MRMVVGLNLGIGELGVTIVSKLMGLAGRAGRMARMRRAGQESRLVLRLSDSTSVLLVATHQSASHLRGRGED